MKPLGPTMLALALVTGLALTACTGGHGRSSTPPSSSSSAQTASPSTDAPLPSVVTSFDGMRLTHPTSWRYVPNELNPGGFEPLGFLSSQPTRAQCPPTLAKSYTPCRSPIARLHRGGVLLTVGAALGTRSIAANSAMGGLPSQTSTHLVPADCSPGATYEYSAIVPVPKATQIMFFTLCANAPDQQSLGAINTMFSTATFVS
jgi:hypothetical protein